MTTLTTLTLTKDMGTYWIATTPDGQECFIHATEVNNYPDCDVFSAIVVKNHRINPPLYAKRITDIDTSLIVAPDGLVEGYTDALDFAYAAGLCGKIVFLDQNGENKYYYVSDLATVYVEEFE